MAANDCVSASNLLQFRKPSRPVTLEERQMFDDEHDLLKFFSESLEEIDEKTHESVKKLFSKMKKGISFERFMGAEELQEYPHVSDLFQKFVGKYHVRQNSHEEKEDHFIAERSVDSESLSTEKLERFKVKTVNVGQVNGDKK